MRRRSYKTNKLSSIKLQSVNQLATLILINLGRPIFYLLLYLTYALIFTASLFIQFILQLTKLLPYCFKPIIKTVHRYSILLFDQLNRSLKFSLPAFPFSKNIKALFVTASLLIIAATYFYYNFVYELPNPQQLNHHQPQLTTKIYDRHQQLLYKIYKNENRTLVNFNQIPSTVKYATIAIEDREFYHHNGFSLKGILRALKSILIEKKLQGGSTITQQLVKNTLLSHERTLSRKIKEIILSLRVEAQFTKNQILAMYFNEVSYGGATYGIEEAAQTYFNKSVTQLNLAEAALLAGLPAAPTRYSPFGAHPELAIARQHQVLRRMVEDRYITNETAEQAKAFKLRFAPNQTDIRAPHFVMYVKDLLVQEFGDPLVEKGGLQVITSLDLNLQEMAQQLVSQEIQKLEKLNIQNGAVLITVPKTGEILAMVGSRNYFDFDHDGQVNVTERPRQPGSAIKPVTYSLALANGYTPATIIADTPISYQIPGQPLYSPKNYDGRFHGNITLRQALASSYNVPAVKVASHLGISHLINQAQKMGITTWNDPSRYGLSLTLGGAEVKMTDLVVAYSVLANQGNLVKLHPILEVKNARQRLLKNLNCQLTPVDLNPSQIQTTPYCQPEPAIDPRIAFQLTSILSDNNARSPAFGSHSTLVIPNHQVAVKTGTTTSLRDNWTIGYTQNFLVAVWVGNNDNTPMSHVASGLSGASPIWNQIFTSLIKDQPPHTFPIPENLIPVKICAHTGQPVCSDCPTQIEYFLPGTEPKANCPPLELNNLHPQPQPRPDILTGASIRRE